jgi:hypothetical protein
MKTTFPIPFTQTEEAFFLNCVGEVMMVWASKSGQAKLNISVENGLVDLQLGFKLGQPENPHIPPQYNQSSQNLPKYKTPAQKAKDRARAAAHQQSQLLRTSYESAQPQPNVNPKENLAVSASPLDQQAVSAAQEIHSLHSLHAAPGNPHQHAAVPAACVAQVAAPDTVQSIQASTADTAVCPLLATPPVEQEQQKSNLTSQAKEPASVSQSQVSTTKKTSPDPETKRKMQILFNRADKITEGYSMNHKIAYSGCQGLLDKNKDETSRILCRGKTR